MNRKQITTHPELIKEYGAKPLAFFYLVKSVFRNSTVYNKNKTEISRRTGVSYYLVSKYLNSLIEKEAVQVLNGNYFFKSMFKLNNKLYKKGFVNIDTNTLSTLKDLELELQTTLIAQNISQQHYIIQKRIDLPLLNLDKKYSYYRFGRKKATAEINKLKKVHRNLKPEIDFKDIVITDRSIAKLLNVSSAKSNQIIRKLKYKGVLSTQELKICIGITPKEAPNYKDDMIGYVYESNGLLYKHKGRKVVKFKEMDLSIKEIKVNKEDANCSKQD